MRGSTRKSLAGTLLTAVCLLLLNRHANAGTVLLSEPFSGTATLNGYMFAGSTCLTAGSGGNGIVPACGATAPRDASGAGALQLTPPLGSQSGFIVTNATFPTSAGLVVTFTDYSFAGSQHSGDGLAMFFSDASQAEPSRAGQAGASLAYAQATTGPGLASAYLGIGLDEYGNFSTSQFGHQGGPAHIPETIAVRGSARTNWQYILGFKNASGIATSLPFHFDSPLATTHKANAPTLEITLTASGMLSVAIDTHDGHGFVAYLPATSIVGIGSQPVVPAAVRIGFSASSGGATSRHQIGGLTVATIGAMPTPSPTSPPGSPSVSSQDNVTYHHNNLRTGWYQNETTLTTSNVASSAFHFIKSLATAGKSYSQPLYISAQRVANGSTHNVLLITDSTDVVYAYDADTFGLLWKRDFKNAAAGVRQQLSSDIGCDDTWPNVGIIGTPVIDRGRNRMYVVASTKEGSAYHMRLHALSLGSGADVTGPIEVTGTQGLVSGGSAAVNPEINYNRAGLLETNNTIYVPLSDHCDYDGGFIHGWLIGYNADTLAQVTSLDNMTSKDIGKFDYVTFLGGIWQGGFGIAADAQNNIYFATGNGPNDGAQSDFGMSVMKLPPNLNLSQRSFFTPHNWAQLDDKDSDLGSGGVMLLPDQPAGIKHLAIAGGKGGQKYLLNRDDLGGLHPTDQVPWTANTANGIWGGPAYYVDGAGHQKILYGGTPTLNAYTLNTGASDSLSETSHTIVGALETRNSGVTPVVSSNGTQPGSAVVWAIKTADNNSGATAITLYAFDGANLGRTLFATTAGRWTSNGDTGGAMITPLVANGRVYLATDSIVTIYGTK